MLLLPPHRRSPFLARTLSGALALLFCAALAGCGRSKVAEFVEGPYPRNERIRLREGTLEELLELLASRAPEYRTLQAQGDVLMQQAGVKGKTSFSANLLSRAPGDLRLRASKHPVGTVFEVLTLGDQETAEACVYLNRERELFAGSLEELQDLGGVVGMMTPREMLAAILVNQDLRERLTAGGEFAVKKRGDDLIVSQLEAERGRVLTWVVQRQNGLIREMALHRRAGGVDMIVRYRDYESFGVGPLPTDFTVELPASAAQIRVELNDYRLDPELMDRVFDCPYDKLAPGQSPLPLAELSHRQALEPDAEE